MKAKWKNKKWVAVLSIVLISILCGALGVLNVFGSWQNKLTNRLFEATEVRDDIVIVALDDTSLNASQNESVHITDRVNLTQVFEQIIDMQPKVLALDYMFGNNSSGISYNDLGNLGRKIVSENLDKTEIAKELIMYHEFPHPTDEALADTLDSARNLVMGVIPSNITQMQNDVLQSKVIRSIDILHSKATTEANVAIELNPNDSLARKYFTGFMTQNGKRIESFAVAAARLAGSPYVDQIPTIDANKRMYINYFGFPGAFTHISAIDVFNGDVPKSAIKDKIVLFGPTSQFFNDLEHTPIAPKAQMPGVEIHANALQTILDGKFLVDATATLKVGMIFIMTGLAVGACMFLSIRTSLAVFVTLWIAYYFGNKFAFSSGIILDQMFPYLALVLSLTAVYIYKFFVESKEKAFISDAFGSYVSPEVLQEITKDPAKLALGGEEKIVTVFFSDIRNFTNISEKLSAQGTVQLLNQFFSEMSDIIIANGGTVDKFEGDAIMAVFGAPLPDENHPLLACQAALQMQAKLIELRAKWKAEGQPELFSRMGINTGPVVAGNVGSLERFDYTVMGDTVNLGSRLEGANKFYGTSIMIGKDTNDLLQGQFVTRHIDKLRVKGKDYPVDVFELMGIRTDTQEGAPGETGASTLEQAARTYEEGLALYFAHKFMEAKSKFEECISLKPADGPSSLMIQRCDLYIQNPPGTNWDGAFTLHQK